MVRNVSVFQKIAAGTLLVVTIFRFFFSPSEFISFDEKVHSLKFSPMHVLYDTQRQRSRCVFFFFFLLCRSKSTSVFNVRLRMPIPRQSHFYMITFHPCCIQSQVAKLSTSDIQNATKVGSCNCSNPQFLYSISEKLKVEGVMNIASKTCVHLEVLESSFRCDFMIISSGIIFQATNFPIKATQLIL